MIFFVGDASLRNGVADWRGKQILKKEYDKEGFNSGGGGTYPVQPPPRSTSNSTSRVDSSL